jgi:hypothetical protein
MMPESVLFSIIAMFEDLQSNQEKVSGVCMRDAKKPRKIREQVVFSPTNIVLQFDRQTPSTYSLSAPFFWNASGIFSY